MQIMTLGKNDEVICSILIMFESRKLDLKNAAKNVFVCNGRILRKTENNYRNVFVACLFKSIL